VEGEEDKLQNFLRSLSLAQIPAYKKKYCLWDSLSHKIQKIVFLNIWLCAIIGGKDQCKLKSSACKYVTYMAFLGVWEDDRAVSALINSVITCVQQSSIWNWNVPVCVVWQLLGARVSVWRTSLHLTQWPVALSSVGEDQSGGLKLNKTRVRCLRWVSCVWKLSLDASSCFAVFVPQKRLD